MATKQTAFRLPEDLVERLDAYAKQVERENPGMTVSRADAVRMLLTRALDLAASDRSETESRQSARRRAREE